MKSAIGIRLAAIPVLALVISANEALAQRVADSPNWLGGYPLANTRREAISQLSFQRPLDAKTVRHWMELASRNTMAEFALFAAPLTPQEAELQKVIDDMPAPIVNRLHFEDLRGVFKRKGLLSLREEEKLQGGDVQHTTPGIENLLFGAYDCVFASIGPPHGSPRYGDVIIRLEDRVRDHGWATPTSGMHFMWAVRHKDARAIQTLLAAGKSLPLPPSPLSLGFDDRLAFSQVVVTESEWNQALAYQAILVLRNLDDSAASEKVRKRLKVMLSTQEATEFWTLFIPAQEPNLTPVETAARVPFGYLEGKFPNRFSIDDFSSIEVAPDQLKEIRTWPEATPYLHLVREKPAGVK